MLDRGLARRFDVKVEQDAKAVSQGALGDPAQDAGAAPRRDLRDRPTFTIDPVTARDFDDAISAEALGGERRRVWVHIADVTAFVRAGSALDRNAQRRGTSVYVPGAVEPMLPKALSNGACSLRPGEDRLAVTAELDFDGAEVTRASFYRSTIRSDARLDYDRVDRIFAGDEQAQAPWAEPLGVARAVAAALAERRRKRGALVVESTEPEFDFDRDGNVTGWRPSVQTESHSLIEQLMVTANEAVARHLESRRLPTLYRVHERPDPPRIERLVDQLASLDVPTPPLPQHMTPQQAEDLAGVCSVAVEEYVRKTGHGRAALTSLVLRSLKQAHYTPENTGHSGLRSPCYCHFTSPIRRYPDIVVHRALLASIGAGEPAAPKASLLPALGEETSAREREAMSIERAADDVARCFLLERALLEGGWQREFTGEVVGLIGGGAFIAFGEGPTGEPGAFEGMLPVRRLRGGWWELNEEGTILQSDGEGHAIRLGDEVVVQVGRIDTARGRVDLHPVEV